ncbi:dynamin family protein, partial [Oleiphilus sp. HI0123]
MSTLKKLRLGLNPKKSQEEIATLVGVSLSIYQRAEADPESASPKLLLSLCKLYGVTLNDLLTDQEEMEALSITPPYVNLLKHSSLLRSYFSKPSISTNDETENLIGSLLSRLSAVARKPNLGVMGRSDAGKSHFINYLLGEAKLPSKLQPTTSAITVLKHIEDRPETVKDDVLIFNELCDISLLDSPSYYEQNDIIYKAGGYDLLSDEIVHDHFEEKESDAYSCVVFIDAPILTACNILDAPGFSNTDLGRGDRSDTTKALSVLTMLDTLVYMSPVTGCMDSTDIASLRTVIKSVPEPQNFDLPPMNNIFFVVSQASDNWSDVQLDELKKTAATRIYNHFLISDNDGLLHERTKDYSEPISPDTLASRFFTFWAESVDRRKDLTDELTSYLQSTMPSMIDGNVDRTLVEFKEKGCSYLSEKISQAENEIIQFENLITSYKEAIRPENVAAKTSKIENLRSSLLTSKKKKTAALKMFSERLIARHKEVDYLEGIIKDKYKDKNEAKEYAFPHIM